MHNIFKQLLENLIFENFNKSERFIEFLNGNWGETVKWQDFTAILTQNDIDNVGADADDAIFEYKIAINVHHNNNPLPFLTATTTIIVEVAVTKQDIFNIKWNFIPNKSAQTNDLLADLLKV